MIRILISFFVAGSTAFATPVPICAKIFRRQFRNTSVALLPFQTTAAGGAGYFVYDMFQSTKSDELKLGRFLANAVGVGAAIGTSWNLIQQKRFLWVIYKARLEMESENVGYFSFALTQYLNSLLDGHVFFNLRNTGALPDSVLGINNAYAQSMVGRRFTADDVKQIFYLLEQKGDLCPTNLFGVTPYKLLEMMVWVFVANRGLPSTMSQH